MNYKILQASSRHIPFLPDIESAAERLFATDDLPVPLRSINTPLADFEIAVDNHLLWVAVDELESPVAFLLADVVDGCFHIAEFDVHPSHGRIGIGTKLLGHALQVAKERLFPAVILTTFEHLPWNAAFYRQHGLEVLDREQIGKGLAAILLHENALGLKRRVAMGLILDPDFAFCAECFSN